MRTVHVLTSQRHAETCEAKMAKPEELRKKALQMVAKGESRTGVARKLGVSIPTVTRWVEKYATTAPAKPKAKMQAGGSSEKGTHLYFVFDLPSNFTKFSEDFSNSYDLAPSLLLADSPEEAVSSYVNSLPADEGGEVVAVVLASSISVYRSSVVTTLRVEPLRTTESAPNDQTTATAEEEV